VSKTLRARIDVQVDRHALSRLSYCCGVTILGECSDSSEDYVREAAVPRQPWSELPSGIRAELAHLGEQAPSWDRRVAIGCVHADIGERMREISPFLASQTVADRFMATDHYASIRDCLGADVESVSSDGLPQILGISVRPPGLRTTTYNASLGKRIGLHVDSWDGLPHTRRPSARNRLCINLGTEDRYFVFCPTTVSTIYSELSQTGGCESFHHVVNRFFQEFPDSPVLCLRLKPGEYYVAPTENLIHDATTAPKSRPDVAFSMLGRFAIPL
jgi:hypothetical protein